MAGRRRSRTTGSTPTACSRSTRPSLRCRGASTAATPVDAFGGDPHLQDLVAAVRARGFPHRGRPRRADPAPRSGAARREPQLRSRLVRTAPCSSRPCGASRGGACACSAFPRCRSPGVWLHKLGSIGRRPHDVAALLRAGHLAAAPLAPTWLRSTPGDPPRGLLAATLGFPVVPVAVRPGGPFGLPVRRVARRGRRADRSHRTAPGPATSSARPSCPSRSAPRIRDLLEEHRREQVTHEARGERPTGSRSRTTCTGAIGRHAGRDAPGPRHGLAGLGAPAVRVRAPPPLLRDRQPRRRAARRRAPRPFSLEQMADDAVAVLDAEGVDRAHVMGASMGGVIAQMLAVRHPDRVRSLVLACTSCRHHEWRRELFAEWADAVTERGMGALGGDGLVWLVGPRLQRRFGSVDQPARAHPAAGHAGELRRAGPRDPRRVRRAALRARR